MRVGDRVIFTATNGRPDFGDVGDLGTVTGISDTGAYVQLDKNINGFMATSEIKKYNTKFSINQEISVQVNDIENDQQKISK